jgi:hypothetical protein
MEADKEKLGAEEFKRLFGVKKETYTKMLEILEAAYKELHKAGGRPSRLSVEDKLSVTLQYLREYRTMAHIGWDWGVAKSRVHDAIKWVENTLVKDGTFSLPGKKVLRESADEITYIVVDVTESPVERPKKNRKSITAGRKSGIP